MTKREFFEKVKNGEFDEEIAAFADQELGKLDHTNELRKVAAATKAVEKEAERAPIREAVMKVMTVEPKTASMLIEEAGVTITPQSIPSLLKGLIEEGVVVKSDVKIPGKGKQKGYSLA